MSKTFVLFALCAVTAVVGAQTWSNTAPGTFIDISTTGGTAILGAGDDTSHSIVTTVGNAAFPAGPVLIGSNGVALSSSAPAGTFVTYGNFCNATYASSYFPAGNAALMPMWNDLMALNPNTTIYWQEASGVLVIMWKGIGHYFAVAGQDVTFEIQVFANPPSCSSPLIQFLYNDMTFGGSQAGDDNGAVATVGYLAGTTGLADAQYSCNQGIITAGTVLSMTYQPFVFAISSPAGPGSVQINISDCSGLSTKYFIPYTFSAGVYPAGWLYGLDITWADTVNIFNAGYPFVRNLPQTIGPVTGLPSGLQFWMVAIGLNGSYTPTGKFGRQTYVIP